MKGEKKDMLQTSQKNRKKARKTNRGGILLIGLPLRFLRSARRACVFIACARTQGQARPHAYYLPFSFSFFLFCSHFIGFICYKWKLWVKLWKNENLFSAIRQSCLVCLVSSFLSLLLYRFTPQSFTPLSFIPSRVQVKE